MEPADEISRALEAIQDDSRANRLEAAVLKCQALIQRFPSDARAWTQLGRIAAQQSRLADAEAAIRKVLELEPENAPVWNWLGRIARSRGHIVESEQYLRKAVCLRPEVVTFWLDLGTTLCDVENWDAAVSAFSTARSLEPQNALVLSNLAASTLRTGKPDDAEALARMAIILDSSRASYWANLGACLFEQLRWQQAGDAFQEAVSRDSENAAIWSNLGQAQQRAGDLVQAQAAFERSLAIEPNQLDARVGLATVIALRGQPSQALGIIQNALNQFPNHAPTWLAAGIALGLEGRKQESISSLRRAFQLAPFRFEAKYALALALSDHSDFDEAEVLARELIADVPSAKNNWTLLAGVLQGQRRLDESAQALHRAMELEADPQTHSWLLLQSQYRDTVDPAVLLESHTQWNTAYVRPLTDAFTSRPVSRTINRPLRIGFLSSDFRIHAIGFFALQAFEHLKSECTLVCYSDWIGTDFISQRFQANAAVWRNTAGLSDDELASLVRTDEIDILVDLIGHTGKRLLVFARKPAPVQITWLGYVGTTGVEVIDYLIADRFHVREGEEKYYTEQVLRMPNDYACFSPPDYTPVINLLPAQTAGYVTFGCFNNPVKFSDAILDVWAKILRLEPMSKLFLRYAGLDQQSVNQRLRDRFITRGIGSDRLIIEGRAAHPELLATYSRVDLALDTLPYSGGLTTCEALWMGVPVITTPGKTFAGRHSTSHLINAGYGEFVAPDLDRYVELALQWSSNLDELARVRSQMRDRVRQSPLCDGPRFAHDLLALFNQVRAS